MGDSCSKKNQDLTNYIFKPIYLLDDLVDFNPKTKLNIYLTNLLLLKITPYVSQIKVKLFGKIIDFSEYCTLIMF